MQKQKTAEKIEEGVEKVSEAITESTLWEKFVDFLEYKIIDFNYGSGEDAHDIVLKVKYVVLVAIVLIATTYVLRWVKRLVTRKMPREDKAKFNTVFSFSRWVIYLIVLLIVLDSAGINVTAIFAASAAGFE